jgi:hypothetical protein
LRGVDDFWILEGGLWVEVGADSAANTLAAQEAVFELAEQDAGSAESDHRKVAQQQRRKSDEDTHGHQPVSEERYDAGHDGHGV